MCGCWPEKSFVADLDIDSPSMVEIAVQVEDEFGMKIPDGQLVELQTTSDAVNCIVAGRSAVSRPRPARRSAGSAERRPSVPDVSPRRRGRLLIVPAARRQLPKH
jgi:acyl carrier protein